MGPNVKLNKISSQLTGDKVNDHWFCKRKGVTDDGADKRRRSSNALVPVHYFRQPLISLHEVYAAGLTEEDMDKPQVWWRGNARFSK